MPRDPRTTAIEAREVRAGMRLDLEDDEYGNNDTAEFEFATVESAEREHDMIVICTSQANFACPPHHILFTYDAPGD